jgi:hypothetical protein
MESSVQGPLFIIPPWGYGNSPVAIADPRHEQHEEMLEWPGPFDPEVFEARLATKQMSKVK